MPMRQVARWWRHGDPPFRPGWFYRWGVFVLWGVLLVGGLGAIWLFNGWN